MWFTIIKLLAKFILPIIFSSLSKTHAAEETHALAEKLGMEVVKEVVGTKTYSAPTDFPEQISHNFNR